MFLLMLPSPLFSYEFEVFKCEYFPDNSHFVVIIRFDTGLINDINESFRDGLDYKLVLEFDIGKEKVVKNYIFSYDPINKMYIVESGDKKRFKDYKNFVNFVLNLPVVVETKNPPARVRAIVKNEYLTGFWSLFGLFSNYKTDWHPCFLNYEVRKK